MKPSLTWGYADTDYGYLNVRGYAKVPADGQLRSPLVASESPHLAHVVSARS